MSQEAEKQQMFNESSFAVQERKNLLFATEN